VPIAIAGIRIDLKRAPSYNGATAISRTTLDVISWKVVALLITTISMSLSPHDYHLEGLHPAGILPFIFYPYPPNVFQPPAAISYFPEDG